MHRIHGGTHFFVPLPHKQPALFFNQQTEGCCVITRSLRVCVSAQRDSVRRPFSKTKHGVFVWFADGHKNDRLHIYRGICHQCCSHARSCITTERRVRQFAQTCRCSSCGAATHDEENPDFLYTRANVMAL